ncbi:alpha/beta hydrolase [Lactococcus garvieae]|uniref:alpha/beta hydrolase n=1 Tax=Lactococcus garvieae TaxID=1363 RepID=UPI0018D73CD6|nr:alpha/beta hydrolase [Lactococcus garvieae]QPS71808.1 alpha/beta hydrolase [Lactococcus garvieae]
MRTKTFTFDDEASLTVYLHEDKEEFSRVGNRPFVLVIPGGGYSFCSEREGEPIALNFLAQGYHAGVLHYHVGDKRSFEKSLEDAQKALRKIQDLATTWMIDDKKIAVIGFSAGGHLAAALSTLSPVKPSLCILGYPAILKSFAQVMQIEAPSLETCVTRETPPTFLFSTFEDNVVPIENSLLYLRALEENDIPFEAHIFQKGLHGLSLATKMFGAQEKMVDKRFSRWFSEAVEWMEINWKATGDKPAPESVIDYSIGNLLEDSNNQDILLQAFPHWKDRSKLKIVKKLTLSQLSELIPEKFGEEQCKKILERLTKPSQYIT